MENILHEINGCEVCGNENLDSVLDLGAHPLCDDLVPVGDNRVCREYPTEILFCEKCITAHQRIRVPKQELFPASYHYRARFTADVLKGMEDLAESCAHRFGSLSGKKVLDIGCNDGNLLDCFRKQGAITIGIEPTDACLDAKEKGHVIYNEFLSEEVANTIVSLHGNPDVITFTNVFAHIENLPEVIRSLKRLAAPHTIILIENHYLGSVLNGNQFDTFYHEHCRTYSYTSFVYVARSLGIELSDVEFTSRYGGNVRVFLGGSPIIGNCSDINLDELTAQEKLFFEGFTTLQDNMERWRKSKKIFLIEQVRQHGPIRAKAFPARAAILIKLLGLNEDHIAAVYEKPGSMKIGHYLPGTRIPICSDDDLFSLPEKNAPVLNMAWHIPNEIRSYLTKNGCSGPIFDILNTKDFLPVQ